MRTKPLGSTEAGRRDQSNIPCCDDSSVLPSGQPIHAGAVRRLVAVHAKCATGNFHHSLCSSLWIRPRRAHSSLQARLSQRNRGELFSSFPECGFDQESFSLCNPAVSRTHFSADAIKRIFETHVSKNRGRTQSARTVPSRCQTGMHPRDGNRSGIVPVQTAARE